MLLLLSLLGSLPVAPRIQEIEAPQLPVVQLRRENLVVRESCRIVIPSDRVFEDQDDDGVIQVLGSGLTVEFAPGSVLRGQYSGTPPDRFHGIGILVDGGSEVTLRGLRVSGYRTAILARHTEALTVEDTDLSGNFRQRLRSTPLAEDGGDWLWPQRNEGGEWLQSYGAALWVEQSASPVLRRIRVRRGQNGIVLDRVSHARVYDNDCSFLSGWGLAMWRSSDNLISRNAFDFCVRGYSEGVYNRGQDSAGILVFEQCCRNVFVENSVTHGGDGFFAFAGREAIGEIGEHPLAWYRRRGNNDNLLLRNDFSDAAAHGVELTFSFGNRILDNRLAGNAICGVWGGFSQDTLIAGNRILDNGERGYGLERGGVNIDHSRNNRILGNRFSGNRCGVHLWGGSTDFAKRPWGRSNSLVAEGNLVAGNSFEGDALALQLRGDCECVFAGNSLTGVEKEMEVEKDSVLLDGPVPDDAELAEASAWKGPILGTTHPVAARDSLRGRAAIVIDEWGPWDHEEPLLLDEGRTGTRVAWRIYPADAPVALERPGDADPDLESLFEDGEGFRRLLVRSRSGGVHRFRATLRIGERSYPLDRLLLDLEWKVRVFDWKTDPRQDEAAWRKEAQHGVRTTIRSLDLVFGNGGPSQLVALGPEVAAARIGSDHFGTLAWAEIPLAAGDWRIRTLSDDGIRVRVEGELVVDDWNWHPPKRDRGTFHLDEPRKVRIEVEHFELDGYSTLSVTLEPVR